MKKDDKAKLRSMNHEELVKLLKDKELYLMKFEHMLRTKEGSSALVRNYPGDEKAGRPGRFGNVRKLKKEIATIKTIIKEKNAGHNRTSH